MAILIGHKPQHHPAVLWCRNASPFLYRVCERVAKVTVPVFQPTSHPYQGQWDISASPPKTCQRPELEGALYTLDEHLHQRPQRSVVTLWGYFNGEDSLAFITKRGERG